MLLIPPAAMRRMEAPGGSLSMIFWQQLLRLSVPSMPEREIPSSPPHHYALFDSQHERCPYPSIIHNVQIFSKAEKFKKEDKNQTCPRPAPGPSRRCSARQQPQLPAEGRACRCWRSTPSSHRRGAFRSEGHKSGGRVMTSFTKIRRWRVDVDESCQSQMKHMC